WRVLAAAGLRRLSGPRRRGLGRLLVRGRRPLFGLPRLGLPRGVELPLEHLLDPGDDVRQQRADLVVREPLLAPALDLLADLVQLSQPFLADVDRPPGLGHELIGGGERVAEVALHVLRDRDVRRADGRRVALDEDDLDRDRGRLTRRAARVCDGRVLLVDDVSHHVTDREGELEERGAVLRVDRDRGAGTALPLPLVRVRERGRARERDDREEDGYESAL